MPAKHKDVRFNDMTWMAFFEVRFSKVNSDAIDRIGVSAVFCLVAVGILTAHAGDDGASFCPSSTLVEWTADGFAVPITCCYRLCGGGGCAESVCQQFRQALWALSEKSTASDTSMTNTYDPKVFEENSQNMDKAAKMNVLLYPVGGALIGFGLGAGVVCCGMLKTLATLIGGAAGGYSGYRYGVVRGTELRTQAQAALCLAEIERNSRKTPESGGKGLFGRS